MRTNNRGHRGETNTGNASMNTATLGRRALMVGALAAPAILGKPGRAKAAAQFSLKFATDAASTDPAVIRMKEAAARIARESDGKIDILMLPDAQLGNAGEILNQLTLGAVHMAFASSQLATTVPLAGIINLGFAFPDYPAVWRAFDGPLGARVRKEIEGKVRNTVVFENMTDGGFRQITTSTKPIRTPGDLAGVKIRVPPTPIFSTLFAALGAAPTPIPFGELYTSLQTRLVDGEENALTTVAAGKLQEVQKYCSMTSHAWGGFWTIMNARTWNGLPANLQDIVQKNVKTAIMDERKDTIEANASLRAMFEKQGMQFIEPSQPEFRAALAKTDYYARWKGVFGNEPWQLLEDAVGKLG